MDFLWAILFFAWYEALSLPARAAMARVPASPDVRRALSRVAGPALLILPIWFAGHLTGLVLTQGFGIAWWLALLVLAVHPWRGGWQISRILAYRVAGQPPADVKRELLLDLVTLGLFLAFVAFRRWVPEMTTVAIDTSGADKFMNSMLFWTNWYATTLPPEDYWFMTHPLSYYYWGHFHWAWIGRVGGFPSELALNLAFARMVTLVFESSYLLARAAKLRMSWAIAAGVLVAWAGNPRAVEQFFLVWTSSAGGYDWAGYSYWKPSRAMVDSVIDEFPAFSAILGDFHAHHLALPWITAWFAMMIGAKRWFALPFEPRGEPGLLKGSGIAVALWLSLGLVVVLGNMWNLPIIAFAMALWFLYAVQSGHTRKLGTMLVLYGIFVLLVWAGAQLILGNGPGPLVSQPNGSFWERLPVKWLPAQLRSTTAQLFAMWGLPAVMIAAAAQLRAIVGTQPAVVAVTVLGWILLVMASGGWVPNAAGGAAWTWVAVACWVLALGFGSRPWLSRPVIWVLLGAIAVLLGSELLYVDDVMTGAYERYNSYFKLTYPVWPPLLVGACAASYRFLHPIDDWLHDPTLRPRGLNWGLRAGLVVVLAAALVYPAAGIPARLLQAFRGDQPLREPTLNAVNFLDHRPPYNEEAEMLAWIRAHVPSGQAVAEGVGEYAYGYVGRVASLAGRPVPLGWEHHEMQWRGTSWLDRIQARKQLIDSFYRAQTSEEMRQQAARLGIEWALFGIVERKRYGEPSLDPTVLQRLQSAAPIAAAFPVHQPTVFLFDFRGIKH